MATLLISAAAQGLSFSAAPAAVRNAPQRSGPPAMNELARLRSENEDLRRQIESGVLTSRAARIGLPLAAATSLAFGTKGDYIKELYSESSRLRAVDPRAEVAMATYFPGSLSSRTIERITTTMLTKKGYTYDNTLFATSTCPDEVNSKPDELVDLLKNRWGENFALGGLGGVPFTGRAGFSAYAHHVPGGGKMFILFAPHVGVEFDGQIGALRRVNQAEVSTACGAAVGAYKGLMKEMAVKKKEALDRNEVAAYGVADGVSDYFDAQINFIKLKLQKRLEKVMDAPDAIAYVTYQMYSLVREFFIDELLTAPGFFDFAEEVTVMGGIMVNRGVGGDRFMPLLLQSRGKVRPQAQSGAPPWRCAPARLLCLLGARLAALGQRGTLPGRGRATHRAPGHCLGCSRERASSRAAAHFPTTFDHPAGGRHVQGPLRGGLRQEAGPVGRARRRHHQRGDLRLQPR